MDIATQTIRKEGFLALYKGAPVPASDFAHPRPGMASPLLGVAGVNSLLFASNQFARKLISPYPQLSIGQVALAGSMAGAVQSILASPVEMFKIRMQGQYGKEGKKLRQVVGDMYSEWGWKRGIMRGFWVRRARHERVSLSAELICPDHGSARDPSLRRHVTPRSKS